MLSVPYIPDTALIQDKDTFEVAFPFVLFLSKRIELSR